MIVLEKTNMKIYLLAIITLFTVSCNQNDGLENVGIELADASYLEKNKAVDENPFVDVASQSNSTFSTDFQGASYSDMRQYLKLGQEISPSLVQIEEYLNYFTYDYPEPDLNENVSLNSELSTCPWNAGHYLVRIGIKGKTILPTEMKGSNYVFLVDVTKSMLAPERLSLIQNGLKLLVDNLNSSDNMAIVSYSNYTKLVMNATSCDKKQQIKSFIDNLSTGGTIIDQPSLSYSYGVAINNLITNGNNPVVLISDGDLNIHPSSTNELVKLIEAKKLAGANLTVVGVGGTNPNIHLMEHIPNVGNGNYEYVDKVEQFLKVFVYEKAKFCTVANNVHVNIIFNPKKVESYRLIGYENRDFKLETTDGATVDARVGSSQTITAVYELVMKNLTNDEHVGVVKLKYNKPNEIVGSELQHEVKMSPVLIENASENMRFAASVTAFGLLMKQSKYKGTADKQMVLKLAENANTFDPNNYRKEFISLVNTWSK